MQINIESTRMLGEKSIAHIEGLINNNKWTKSLHFCSVNIDSTLKDVDDAIYVQVVCGFQNKKVSFIASAPNMSEAIKSAIQVINTKIQKKSTEQIAIASDVNIAA